MEWRSIGTDAVKRVSDRRILHPPPAQSSASGATRVVDIDPDPVKTRKLSENGASGANFFVLPGPVMAENAENRLKFINCRPGVRVFTRSGSSAAPARERTSVRKPPHCGNSNVDTIPS